MREPLVDAELHVSRPPAPPETTGGPVDAPVACLICNATRRPDDPVLCRGCGEPVLVVGWAP